MSEFTKLLRAAMDGSQPQQRTIAEQQLQSLCLCETSNFFTSLVQELMQEQNDVPLRQFACALVKNSIRLMGSNKDFLWNSLNSDLREKIKTALLSAMVCRIVVLQKSCANAISTIFTVEILSGRWGHLIDDLTTSTAQQVQGDIRKAAILTLGQICDKLKEFKLGTLLANETKEKILMGILIGLSTEEQDVDIKEISIIALGDCVEFMTEILEREQVRDYTINLLIQALKNPNEKIRITALQRSCDFVKPIYLHFGKYVHAFFEVTAALMDSNDEEMCVPAMEIWSTLAQEYNDRQLKNSQAGNRVNSAPLQNYNHIEPISEHLVQALLKNLLKNDLEDDEEAESSHQEVAQKALSSIVECTNNSIINTFKTFITNTLTHQDWRYRQAAILAFGSLIEGIPQNIILPLIDNIFSSYVNTLNDPSKKVKESGAKLLSKIAEHHPQSILLRNNVGPDLLIIVNSLKDSPQISRQICWFFCFLAENLEKYPTNQIQGSLDPLVQALIENAARNDFQKKDENVINVSFMSALNIIHFSRSVTIGKKYLEIFVGQFKNSYGIPPDRRGPIQSGILSALHACMLTLDDKFDQNLSEIILGLVIEYFCNINNVDSDGMYIISALAICIDSLFSKYIDSVWPYIEHTLKEKKDDIELYKICLGAIADISRACKIDFAPKLGVVPQLFDILESPNFNRDVKLNIFSCIGDIFIATKDSAVQYLPKLIQLFDKSFTASIELSQQDSIDAQEYSEALKEKLIEAYTCVLHGINDSVKNPIFIQHCPKLLEFIKLSCDKNLHPTVEYVRICLVLLLDIGNFYKQEVYSLIKTPFVQNLLETLKKYDQSSEGQEAIFYAQRVF